MTFQEASRIQKSLVGGLLLLSTGAAAEPHFAQINAVTQAERSQIANLGLSIEEVRSDGVWIIAEPEELNKVSGLGFKILNDSPARQAFQSLDFPPKDAIYHNFAETLAALKDMNAKHADITRIVSIGKSTEGRDLWALHINTSPEALMDSRSQKPGAVFMGNHHAREHLTNEVSLKLGQYLLANREDPQIAALLDQRDIWIIPMVNPDGVEHDLSGTDGGYKYWRKNRRDNGAKIRKGVDLNRNYSYQWGKGGSSNDPTSETYMGPEPFSEPESRAIRDFVNSQTNLKMLLTLHTYSELILYPWGFTNKPMDNTKDLAIFEAMGKTMASWNHYTAKQSSGLYITTGDTTDWAYAEHGIYAFTFELSPASGGIGGFYPGPATIEKAFQDNLKPCLYMIDLAQDPERATSEKPKGWLQNYVAPELDPKAFWDVNPY